ncbi:response regulator transcription factor [Catelliglobosispora koreensis]|uniref:response regulator transcription factor n=1 Tax=Catelliglobosispora koreensis TaxID=129052 RepID=UPI00035F78A4|nr:response regulator transcription factor [Catelliglobosispora koreensis]
MRLVIADDSLIIRAGLIKLLGAIDTFDVVGEAADAEQLHRIIAHERPDVAVVDIRMPPTHTDEGIRAASRIRREHPSVAVLVLSQYIEAAYAMELLEGGSTHVGYLLKDRILQRATLIEAIGRIRDGEVVVDSTLVDALLAAPAVPAALEALSEREREVLALMAEGLTDRGIAERLSVSPRTVGTHIQHIFDRLGIADTATDNRRVRAVLSYLDAI